MHGITGSWACWPLVHVRSMFPWSHAFCQPAHLPPSASQTLVCRRTLAGHTDDILSLSGVSVQLPPPDVAELASPKSPTAAVIAGIRWVGGAMSWRCLIAAVMRC